METERERDGRQVINARWTVFGLPGPGFRLPEHKEGNGRGG
jgi:hypothetical protein